VPLTPQQLELAAAVIRGRGRILPYAPLADRVGSDAVNLNNLFGAQMSRMRKAFAAIGAPMPIERVWGQGLRWNRDA
jgi:DNA-binding response OmpR family regulator